jgi:hypothetical protein
MFLYHDRGGFMADISANRMETPLHYTDAFSTNVSANVISSFQISFTAYANQKYYVLLRSQGISFPTESYRLVPYFPSGSNYTALTDSVVGFNPLADPTSNLTNYNYAIEADPAFIQLPTASTLYSPPAVDTSVSSLLFSTGVMGYDTNGVSTDLTDYIGYVPNVGSSNFVPNAVIRIDPANGFIFSSKSPYNLSTQTYIYTNTSNSILQPRGSFVYTPSTIVARQTSLVQWYGTTFLPPSENQALADPTTISYTAIPPFTASYPVQSTLSGYSYTNLYDVYGNNYLNTPNTLNLGNGIFGIGFVPAQGVWDIDRFMFKSIFNSSNADPNLKIKYIGIFNGEMQLITCISNR